MSVFFKSYNRLDCDNLIVDGIECTKLIFRISKKVKEDGFENIKMKAGQLQQGALQAVSGSTKQRSLYLSILYAITVIHELLDWSFAKGKWENDDDGIAYIVWVWLLYPLFWNKTLMCNGELNYKAYNTVGNWIIWCVVHSVIEQGKWMSLLGWIHYDLPVRGRSFINGLFHHVFGLTKLNEVVDAHYVDVGTDAPLVKVPDEIWNIIKTSSMQVMSIYF